VRIALSIAITAVLGAALLATPAVAAPERTVAVRGEATVRVPNDAAKLGFSVSVLRGKRSAALQAVAAGLRSVIAAVQESPGVGEGDVTTTQISVSRVSRPKRDVYRASEGIGVVLHQPELAGDLVSAAIAAGATGTRGPSFFVGDTSAAYDSALAAALTQAKERATALAGAAGASLGPVISIAEDGEVTPEFSEGTAKAAPGCGTTPVAVKRSHRRCAAAPPVKPGRSTVTATVHAVFALL
jgi:uncharacterized protein YggE